MPDELEIPQGSRGGPDQTNHQPKPTIWFFALPLLAVLEVFRLFACGLVWIVRLLRWCLRPRPLVIIAFLLPWIVVFHVVWFAHGWSAFHPLCRDRDDFWREWSELIGPMTPEATEEFHDFFVDWLGPDSVRRSGTNRIDIRPALRMVPTNYLWNISRQVAEVIAARHGIAGRPERNTDDCSFIEEILMEGGKASRHSEGWGYWPYNEIDEFSPLGNYLVLYHCTDRAPRC